MLFCAGVPSGHVTQRGPRGRRLLFQKWRHCRIFQRGHTREPINNGVKFRFRFEAPTACTTCTNQIWSSPCTDWGYEMSSRTWNRGINGLHQLGQPVVPSILFPGRRFISPVCTSCDELHLTIYSDCCKMKPSENQVNYVMHYFMFHSNYIVCFALLYQHDRAHRIAMAAVKAWSDKWYFAEAINILCQESH